MTRNSGTNLTEEPQLASWGASAGRSSSCAPAEPLALPRKIKKRCSLCKHVLDIELGPRPVRVYCHSCGLEFEYNAHLTRSDENDAPLLPYPRSVRAQISEMIRESEQTQHAWQDAGTSDATDSCDDAEETPLGEETKMQESVRDHDPVVLTMTRPVAIPFYGFLGFGILILLALGATSFLGYTVFSLQAELAENRPEGQPENGLANGRDTDSNVSLSIESSPNLTAPILNELNNSFPFVEAETDRTDSTPPRILPPFGEETLTPTDSVMSIAGPTLEQAPASEDFASTESTAVAPMEIPFVPVQQLLPHQSDLASQQSGSLTADTPQISTLHSLEVPAPSDASDSFQTTSLTPMLQAPTPENHLGLSAEAVLSELHENGSVSPETEQTLRDAIASKGGVRFTGHSASIETLAVSSDGRWMLSAGADKTARLWDMNSSDPEATCRVLRAHTERITLAQFTPDGGWVATAGDDGMIFAWPLNQDLDTTEPQPILVGTHRGALTTMEISPDSRCLASAGQGIEPSDLAVKIWNLESILSPLGDPSSRAPVSPIILYGPGSAARSLSFTPDSQRLFVVGDDPTVRLYSIDPPSEPLLFEGHLEAVTRVEIHPSGNWAVTASRDDTLRLWDLQSDSPSETSFVMEGPLDDIECLTLSADGEWIAAGGRDGMARLWNCATNRLYVLEGHEATIRCLMFSPNGRWLATGDSNGEIRLWDAQNPASEYSVLLEGHRGPILTLAARPDGDWLLSGAGASPEGEETDIRLWNLTTEGLLFTAQAVAERSHESIAQRPEEIESAPQDQWETSY